MIYAVQLQACFRNVARRDSVMSAISTKLASETKWGALTLDASPSNAVDPCFVLEVRFPTSEQADLFWNDLLVAVGSGVNGPIVGSNASRHQCRHDEPEDVPCVITQQRTW